MVGQHHTGDGQCLAPTTRPVHKTGTYITSRQTATLQDGLMPRLHNGQNINDDNSSQTYRYMYAKKCRHRDRFDKVMAKIKRCSFFASHGVQLISGTLNNNNVQIAAYCVLTFFIISIAPSSGETRSVIWKRRIVHADRSCLIIELDSLCE